MQRTPSDEPNNSLSFAQVFPLEVERVRESRAGRQVPVDRRGRSAGSDLIGLAFSGGGIRSATFNLGVIEALAGRQLLRWLDYLSTVSGGGYIGSWLSSWAYHIKRANPQGNHIGEIEKELGPHTSQIGDAPEPGQIRFLRQYSNYLTPRLGVLSGDTLAFVGTYLRNLLLNQSILISLMFAVLLAPRVIGLALIYPDHERRIGYIIGGGALVLLIWVLIRISGNIVPATSDSAKRVVQWIAIPQHAFCFSLTIAVWHLSRPGALLPFAFQGWRNLILAWLASAGVYTVFWVIGTLLSSERKSFIQWIPVFWAPPHWFGGGSLYRTGN